MKVVLTRLTSESESVCPGPRSDRLSDSSSEQKTTLFHAVLVSLLPNNKSVNSEFRTLYHARRIAQFQSLLFLLAPSERPR